MEKRNSVAIAENFWRQVWQSRNPDAIDRLVAEDFAITTGGVVIRSRAQFKKWVATFLASIDDFRFDVLETFQNEAGDRVVTRWRVTGKNNGFMGTEPCRSPIDMTGTAILHVREDGLLQHNWVERSALEVYRSLRTSGS
ncbi:ester cyclase [Burkholderia dolosa]|uniref:ester cyclase n=1 Tax=Burkholderia dolosa TaxID=152500 RepID=UPI0015922939|nr:ester cyclase [Burkholderia dolosa]MBR8059817.1 ester cyclase [Burkholderia dolosa]MBR8302457.1 ester cyclase [Burkholderia dolosa]MBR8456610.1 ester cyclase [Burkholderia dolosa]MBY4831481.1 ester cyclase [Burkholderia dolosa]MDN7422695.1 ester cyclase [Burkholderia dolosa]